MIFVCPGNGLSVWLRKIRRRGSGVVNGWSELLGRTWLLTMKIETGCS